MSIGRFLTHRVSIVRRVAVLDVDDDPVVDDYNLPTSAESTTTNVPASIQPRSAKELASTTQAGVATGDYRIYMLPRDIGTADVIVHDPDDCPMTTDLPAGRFEVVAVPDAAGAGHHVEVWANRISTPTTAYATPVGGGS